MRFTVENELSSRFRWGSRFSAARRIIIFYEMRSAEQRLERLIYSEYGITLKSACLKVLNDCVITDNGDTMSISTKSKQTDKLARLITYGNGVVAGSPILTDALR